MKNERNNYTYWDYVANTKRLQREYGWTAEQIAHSTNTQLSVVQKRLAEEIPEDSFCAWDAQTRAKIRTVIARYGIKKASYYLGVPEKRLKALSEWANRPKASYYKLWHDTKYWFQQYSFSFGWSDLANWIKEFYPLSPYLKELEHHESMSPVQSKGAWEELITLPSPMDTVSASYYIAAFRYHHTTFNFTHNGITYFNKRIIYDAKTEHKYRINGVYIILREHKRYNRQFKMDRNRIVSHLKSLPVGERILLTMVHKGYQYGIVLTKTKLDEGPAKWVITGARRTITFYPGVPKWAYESFGENEQLETYSKPRKERRRLPKVSPLPTQVEN
ncbi:hypothetical protein V757_00375 [Pelistega indica]|uniref:Uncharacterized protein n=1 Tax=Pelistega indica TaxID=1414851 RepID=V8GAF7_9BURK|nr:hypothetical protein [Pelistega indica]ETD73096.1 hypothetical protein V757_00375 [Pelistega indica]